MTDPLEAEQVIRGGVDLIDLKDPARGALGALPCEQIRALVTRVTGRSAPPSATCPRTPT